MTYLNGFSPKEFCFLKVTEYTIFAFSLPFSSDKLPYQLQFDIGKEWESWK